MSGNELITLMAAGLVAAMLHASLPTHWLPFVLAARAQGWSMQKTLSINLAAGGGHVLFTAFLGFLIAWAGVNLPKHVEEWSTFVGGVALIALGAFAIWRDRTGRDPHVLGHHHHAHCDHQLPGLPVAQGGRHDGETLHQHDGAAVTAPSVRSQALTIGGLFALVSLSPCEAFLPIYVAGAGHGWTGFLVLTGVLAAGTLGGMLLLTWLTFHTADRLKFKLLERHEGLIIGLVLVALGTFLLAGAH